MKRTFNFGKIAYGNRIGRRINAVDVTIELKDVNGGNGDLVLESGIAFPDLTVSAALSEVEFIGPGAVQIDPVFTDKLRARVLTSRDFCTHCFFSLIFKV